MITKKTTPRYYVGELTFESLPDAQKAALSELMGSRDSDQSWLDALVQKAAQVVDILTTTERSLTKARKINGGRKPRKASNQEQVAA